MIAISILPGFKNIRSKHSEAFNFISALITTLIGVYLGVAIANDQQREIEDKKQVRLLNIIKNDISNSAVNIRQVIVDLKGYMKNADTLDKVSEKTKMFLSHYYLPPLLEFYSSQENFISNIDPILIDAFIFFHNQIKANIALVHDLRYKTTLENFHFHANVYIRYSLALREIIAIQTDIINKKLTDREIRDRVTKAYSQLNFKEGDKQLEIIWWKDTVDIFNDTALIK